MVLRQFNVSWHAPILSLIYNETSLRLCSDQILDETFDNIYYLFTGHLNRLKITLTRLNPDQYKRFADMFPIYSNHICDKELLKCKKELLECKKELLNCLTELLMFKNIMVKMKGRKIENHFEE